jgi:hypothetical protein
MRATDRHAVHIVAGKRPYLAQKVMGLLGIEVAGIEARPVGRLYGWMTNISDPQAAARPAIGPVSDASGDFEVGGRNRRSRKCNKEHGSTPQSRKRSNHRWCPSLGLKLTSSRLSQLGA